MKEKTYEFLWRNKFLCTEAKSFDEFIGILERSVEELKKMRAAGLELEKDGIEDDYAFFVTKDPDLAKEFDMVERNWEEDFEGEFLVVNLEEDEIEDSAETLEEACQIVKDLLKERPIGASFAVESDDSNIVIFTKHADGSIQERVISE